VVENKTYEHQQTLRDRPIGVMSDGRVCLLNPREIDDDTLMRREIFGSH